MQCNVISDHIISCHNISKHITSVSTYHIPCHIQYHISYHISNHIACIIYHKSYIIHQISYIIQHISYPFQYHININIISLHHIVSHYVILYHNYRMYIWWFPKIVVPTNHPFIDRIFHELNHPAGYGNPLFWMPVIHAFSVVATLHSTNSLRQTVVTPSAWRRQLHPGPTFWWN